MRHHTGEHPLHRLPPLPSWPRRRTVENVLFAVIVTLLFASAVKRAHHAHHERNATSCGQEK